jgi:hypothetical protein
LGRFLSWPGKSQASAGFDELGVKKCVSKRERERRRRGRENVLTNIP